VSVYSPPGDIPEGPVEFNILSQDRSTHEVLLDAKALLSAHPEGDTANCSTGQASYDVSENKLFQSGQLTLGTAGNWMLDIVLWRNGQSAKFSVPIRLVKEEARFSVPWSYVLLLAVAAGLMLIYVRRHRANESKFTLP
jgi:hypothetical protein